MIRQRNRVGCSSGRPVPRLPHRFRNLRRTVRLIVVEVIDSHYVSSALAGSDDVCREPERRMPLCGRKRFWAAKHKRSRRSVSPRGKTESVWVIWGPGSPTKLHPTLEQCSFLHHGHAGCARSVTHPGAAHLGPAATLRIYGLTRPTEVSMRSSDTTETGSFELAQVDFSGRSAIVLMNCSIPHWPQTCSRSAIFARGRTRMSPPLVRAGGLRSRAVRQSRRSRPCSSSFE